MIGPNFKEAVSACVLGSKSLPPGKQADALEGLADMLDCLTAHTHVPSGLMDALRMKAASTREGEAARRMIEEELELF